MAWVIGGARVPSKPWIGLGFKSSTGDIFSMSQIRCASTAFIKFPPVAPVSIRAMTLILDFPILQTVVNGTSGSKPGVRDEEVAIRAVKPLKTSLSEVILFPSPLALDSESHGFEIFASLSQGTQWHDDLSADRQNNVPPS